MLPNSNLYPHHMIKSELSWIVGKDYVQSDDSQKLGHSIDYYWVPEVWHDRGQTMSAPDVVVQPANAKEHVPYSRHTMGRRFGFAGRRPSHLRRHHSRHEADEQSP